MEFDALFVCGNQEFRTEVIAGIKESDVARRVAIVHDIPIAVDSTNISTIYQLKQNIPNITEYIKEDTIFVEKQWLDLLTDYLQYNEELKIDFGIDSLKEALVGHNVKRIVIDEMLELQISQMDAV